LKVENEIVRCSSAQVRSAGDAFRAVRRRRRKVSLLFCVAAKDASGTSRTNRRH